MAAAIMKVLYSELSQYSRESDFQSILDNLIGIWRCRAKAKASIWADDVHMLVRFLDALATQSRTNLPTLTSLVSVVHKLAADHIVVILSTWKRILETRTEKGKETIAKEVVMNWYLNAASVWKQAIEFIDDDLVLLLAPVYTMKLV